MVAYGCSEAFIMACVRVGVMLETIVQTAVAIKRNLAKEYRGNAHIQEALPSDASDMFPIDGQQLRALHNFAKKNPIYFNSFEQELAGVACTIYEGDINEYWLNSIKHGSSCQSFYPTWIVSAFVLAKIVQEAGFREVVDIGSGDGRIAFCGKVLGMRAHSIEVDDVLVELQRAICDETGHDIRPQCHDAINYDYSQLHLTHPVLLVGALPQMGGDVLAEGVIGRMAGVLQSTAEEVGMVLAGMHSKRELLVGHGNDQTGGWDAFIQKHGLRKTRTVSLPTVWTFDQQVETPYTCTMLR